MLGMCSQSPPVQLTSSPVPHDCQNHSLWPPCVADADIIFLPCGFYLSSFFLAISFITDWMSTILPHMVWPYCESRMQVCCTRLAGNTGRKKLPSAHHRTTLSDYIFASKACIDNRKKTVKQQYLLYMSPQYGELRPTSG